ncbi:MAG: LTA synthase family protein [Candidatus Staskawiczbacteria bacterium]
MDLKNSNKIFKYVKIIFLPLLLVVLFVIQNQAFNYWLGFYSKDYFIRLLFVTFVLGVFFYGPSLFFRKKYKYWYLLLVSFLISLIFIAQFLYFRYSQSFLQFSALRYSHQADSVMGTVKTLITPELYIFIINIAIVLIAYILYIKQKITDFFLSNWEKTVIILTMLAIVFLGYNYLLSKEKKEWGDISRLYTKVYDLKVLASKMGIVNFFLEDGLKYTLRSNLVSKKDKQFLEYFLKNRVQPPLGEHFGIDKGKNLIIIEVESLENSVINQKVNGQEITPNLNKLAKEGLYFDNYYSQVGPGNTADAEFSTMNSLYPLANDVVFTSYPKNIYKALPKLLVDNGYKTYSLHGDVPTFWNRSNVYPGLGYQKTYNLSDYEITKSVGEGPSDLGDEDFFYQSIIKLEEFPQPFMAMLITMSSHTPFILPADLQTLKIAERTNLTWIQWEYLQSIHYVDQAIGQFINGLKQNGLYDNSLILIWGDHGSFMNMSSALYPENIIKGTEEYQLYKNLDVEFIGNPSTSLRTSNKILPELSNDHVPMIILNSNVESRTVNEPASHLDVYPTVANLLGVVAPKSIFGQDLLNTKNPIETHFKLISGGIDAILTKDVSYQADESGIFQNGFCKSIISQKDLPITECQKIYTEQLNNLKASRIIIRGNLLPELLK